MIPIRDTIHSDTYPVVNNSLIVINVLVFLYQSSLGPNFNDFVFTYGLIPSRYSMPEISAHFSAAQQFFSFVSFMFLHGGFLHLLGNMWTLYIFGDNVEDRLGHVRYFVFYMLCGLASGLFHFFSNYYSQFPTVGASGAIAGVMGAYFVLFPKAKVLTLIPIFIFIQFVELPAFFFLGIWFLMQFLNATGEQTANSGGIAWWAHIGGFLSGIILLRLSDRAPRVIGADRLRDMTKKRGTPRIQVVRPFSIEGDPDLHGVVELTRLEAAAGTKKMITLAEGFRRRSLLVTIPPGATEDSRLRLRGVGRKLDNETRGDLYLQIQIKGQLEPAGNSWG